MIPARPAKGSHWPSPSPASEITSASRSNDLSVMLAGGAALRCARPYPAAARPVGGA